MACLAPEPVPTWLFSQAPLVLQRDDEAATARVSFSQAEEEVYGRAVGLTDLPTLDRAVAAMHRYGLITRAREGLRMHPLVGTVIRETISGPERSAWIESALGFLLRQMVSPWTVPEQKPLTPHAAGLLQRSPGLAGRPG